VGAIYAQFDTIAGRDAGTAFMAALLAIKFYELRGPRDIAMIIFASFFLVMSSLLYSQSLELFVYCLLMMWVLTALLLRTQMGDRPDDRLLLLLRTAGVVFLQAFPLALFLFFFFPRYQGVLQIGFDDSSTGLTDTLKPGSISRLANDDSTAMTVKITDGHFVSPETMYWRALVLWNYENGAWTVGNSKALTREQWPRPAPETAVVDQEITVWPHFHNWLFALDCPVADAKLFDGTPDWSTFQSGDIVQMRFGQLNQMERYQIQSAPLLADEELSAEESALGVELPHGHGDEIDPRVRALADQLHAGCADATAYVNAVLHFFRHGGFVYSEDPGPSGPHALYNFLFKRKVGFCEHYASAFAILMRLENVPARIVAGYQGAQFNPYKNIYIVKQSNAHAWDEVWIEADKRWRRIDPTAIISSGDNLPGAANPLTRGRNDGLTINVANHRVTLLSAAYMPDWMRQSLQEMQLRRQEVEADWDDWIFSYNPQTQYRWAQALGFRGGRFTLAMACLVAITVSAAALRFAMRRRQVVSPVENFYDKLCRNMARRGVPRAAWEGPLAYTERVAEAFPENRPAIERAGKLVAETRYGAEALGASRDELKSLETAILESNAGQRDSKAVLR
jgi:hypothetical protein